MRAILKVNPRADRRAAAAERWLVTSPPASAITRRTPVAPPVSAPVPSSPGPALRASSAPSGRRKSRGSCRWNGYGPTRGAAPG